MSDLSIEEIPRHAALAKLARVLEVPDDEVAFLGGLEVEDLRALRLQVTDRLHAADAARLGKVAAASRLIPQAMAASIGQHWFGATLCARLVGLIEPERGGQFARHLDLEFMADITARTDPRVVGDLVEHLPLESMRGIATTLLDRGDHLTLSHFVGHIPPGVVARILEAITDNAAVVRIAQYVEDLSDLDPVVALLPEDRLLALANAVDREDLWVEGLHLFGHLGTTQIERFAITLVDNDVALLRAALEAFERHDLWAEGLGILETVEGERMANVAMVLVDLDDDLVQAAVDAVVHNDLWDLLVHAGVAAEHLPDEVRARLVAVIDQQPDGLVEQFDAAAGRLGHAGLRARLLGG